jgi:hypothetical protein
LRVVITGHVGLLTAATLAAIVHDVVGVEEDEEKIDRPERGMSPLLRTRTPGADRTGLELEALALRGRRGRRRRERGHPVRLRRHARQPPVRRTWPPSSDPRPTDRRCRGPLSRHFLSEVEARLGGPDSSDERLQQTTDWAREALERLRVGRELSGEESTAGSVLELVESWHRRRT